MYERILSRLTAPLMLAEAKYLDIQTAIATPLFLGQTPGAIDKASVDAIRLDGTTAIIPIKGTLTSGNSTGDSGTRSYPSISADIRSAISNGAKNLAFHISSYGGETDGAFGLAKYIQALPTLHNVRTIAIIDGPCCSAGYLMASAMQEILVTESSELGSIGVIASIPNAVQSDSKAGVNWTIIRSHSEKALGNPHEELSKEAIASIRSKVDSLASIMIDTITTGRPTLSKDTIATLNGKTVLGKEAISLGLADRLIESVDISLEMIKRGNKPMSENSSPSLASMEELVKLKAELEATKLASATAVAKAISDERARCLAVLDAAKAFGLSQDVAIKQITLNSSAEQATAMFEAVKEAIQMANPTPAAPMATSQLPEASGNPFASWIQGNEYLASMK